MAGGDSRFERPAGGVMAVGNPRGPNTPVAGVVADLARFDWRARGSSKYGSLPLAIYVQYAFIDALAELA
jgi:hypothetical protein